MVTETPVWRLKATNSGEPNDRWIDACEHHALAETNAAFRALKLDEAKSMTEAALVADLILALKRDPDCGEFLTYHESGICQFCEEEAESA